MLPDLQRIHISFLVRRAFLEFCIQYKLLSMFMSLTLYPLNCLFLQIISVVSKDRDFAKMSYLTKFFSFWWTTIVLDFTNIGTQITIKELLKIMTSLKRRWLKTMSYHIFSLQTFGTKPHWRGTSPGFRWLQKIKANVSNLKFHDEENC